MSTPQKVIKPRPTLQQYIEKHGPVKIANAIGSKKNCVYEWWSLKRQPSFYFACKLVKVSKGRLDFNSIYKPFLNK